MKLKKWIQISALVVVFLTMTGMTSANFTDIKEDRVSFEIIQEFSNRGLTKGYPDGTFRPDQGVSRAEFISFVNRSFNFDSSEAKIEFTDIRGTEWFLSELRTAVGEGYIAGYPDGTFRPNKLVTRQEVAAILQRILNYELIEFKPIDEKMQPWAEKSIHIMMSNGVILPREKGFEGNSEMTREEMAVSLMSAIHKEEAKAKKEKETEKDPKKDTTPTKEKQAEKDKASSGGGGGGGGTSNKNDNKDNPSKPEKDITSPPADTIHALNRAVTGLESILAKEDDYGKKLNNDQQEIVKDVKSSVNSYLKDHHYNIDADKNQVKGQVNKLTQTQQEELKNAIQANIPFEYIGKLQDFFYEN